MKPATLLLIIALCLAVVYLICSCRRRRNHFVSTLLTGMGIGVGDATPTDACSWLVSDMNETGYYTDGYMSQISSLCSNYGTLCGEGSAATEVLNISENVEFGPDQSVLNYLKSDYESAQANKAACQPLMKCDGSTPCPDFLSCVNGGCVPEKPQ